MLGFLLLEDYACSRKYGMQQHAKHLDPDGTFYSTLVVTTVLLTQMLLQER